MNWIDRLISHPSTSSGCPDQDMVSLSNHEVTESKKTLRDFGLLVGGIFALIGLFPLFGTQRSVHLWALIVACLLMIPALLFPVVLKIPYGIWMKLGHILGWINSRLILGAVFYLIFTPVALVIKLFGKDPLKRAANREQLTYRVEVPERSMAKEEMERQF